MPASITENSATLSRLDEPRPRTPADPRTLDERRDADDATRLAPEAHAGDTPPAAQSAGIVTSSSGWLSSSDAIDHGRFDPAPSSAAATASSNDAAAAAWARSIAPTT